MARTGTQSLFAAQDIVVQGDGSIAGALAVAGAASVGGALSIVGNLSASTSTPSPMPETTLEGNANVLTVPGAYRYKSNNVQATIPVASSMPGAMFVFTPWIAAVKASLGGTNIILSGTAVNDQGANTAVFYQQTSGTFGGTGNSRGKFLTTPTSGSVGLMSDGNMWLVLASSGSLTFSS